MTIRQLLGRSLRFHLRDHLGVLLGAAVSAAVLIGALAVGDSVRGSLREQALARLATFNIAVHSPDRFFTQALSENLARIGDTVTKAPRPKPRDYSSVLQLAGSVSRQDGSRRANRVTAYGIDPDTYWPLLGAAPAFSRKLASDEVWLSSALYSQLGARIGEELVLRIHKPSALSRDAVITPRDDAAVALRLRVAGVLQSEGGGDLSLKSGQEPPLNLFVDRARLGAAAGLDGKANLLLGRDPARAGDLPAWVARVSTFFMERGLYRLGFEVLAWAGQGPAAGAVLEADNQKRLKDQWTLADAELSLRLHESAPGGSPASVELTTSRIFLDPAVTAAASRAVLSNTQSVPLLTYLVNSVSSDAGLTPYSMVTAAGPPWTPADLADDEILVNEWLANDLRLKPGDRVALLYYRADSAASLAELTNTFRVRGIVPMKGVHGDRTLMPEFPGLSKAESTHDWDAGFDLVHKIRDQDEAYWKQWRGTPKAFVNLRVGQRMWANRFGELTAIRWFPSEAGSGTGALGNFQTTLGAELRKQLDPADVGLRFQSIGERTLEGASGSQDFGGLFIGFSFFLIVSALLLTALLFRFGLEQRATELGTLLAVGWEPRRVTRLFLREGLALASIGSVFGSFGGVQYGKAVIWGLNTIWSDAVAGAGLQFHVTGATLVGGALGSIAVAGGALWLALRSAAKRPARELLNEGVSGRAWNLEAGRRRRWLAVTATVFAIALMGAGWAVPEAVRPGLFFGAGALLLTAGLLWVREWLLGSLSAIRGVAASSWTALALRAPARKPARSLTTVALLSSAAFLIVAVGANKLDARRDAHLRSSGTGGFAFWGETALPVIPDLNSTKGQEQSGLDPKRMAAAGLRVVAMRVRDGDDASCLNLNLAQRPRLLGVNPAELASRGAFTFKSLAKVLEVTNGWDALRPVAGAAEVPAIGDANSIQWALKKSLGDTLEYVDERGQTFRVRLVGAVANSILQGNLIIDEAEFVKRFPSEAGKRAFLVDATAPGGLDSELSRALQDSGMELIPAAVRMARFNAIQNTYLNTFQVLGGLGLLLGSFGLGVVVLRNVFERRGELGVLQAVGFRRSALERMVIVEHGLLLVSGLALGTLASGLVILPALLSPGGGGIPWLSLGATLAGVLANGFLWTWLATRRALHGSLLGALRGE